LEIQWSVAEIAHRFGMRTVDAARMAPDVLSNSSRLSSARQTKLEFQDLGLGFQDLQRFHTK
jgi:hypothetical protein